jgi:uncharacterized protein YbjT (DUF2867 family)
MQRILVTGGAGGFGGALVPQLAEQGYTVRVMSRRAAPAAAPGLEWAQADLTTGAGLARALAGVDIVAHAASSPFKHTWETDVEGTRRLLAAAREAGIAHIAYISIVGIEHVPYQYYRAKLAAEALVRDAGLPWSILRATQFHTLIDMFLRQADRLPIMPLPTDFLFQPIDTGEAAARFAAALAAGPSGRLPDIGGPEVLTLGAMARAWLKARGKSRRIIHMPLPGAFAAAMRQGRLTTPGQRHGLISWADWVGGTYAQAAAVTSL